MEARKTPLYEDHVRYGGKIVEFAGYLINEETLIMNYITMAIVILIAILASRNLKEVPTGWQNAIEAIAELWEDKINTMIGPTGRSLTHIFLSLFVYLVIANWLGLFPAMESPTNDLNTTLGLALTMSLLIHHGIGVMRNGVGYFKHFFEPFAPFVLIHVIEELARPASLAFRLFGNILAGEVLNTATATADPINDPKDPENPKTPEGEDTVITGDPDDPDGPTPPVDRNVTLTVRYFYEGTSTPFRTFERTYTVGSRYNVASPTVTGWTPDKARVSGTILRDTVIDVYYTINQHTLTIQYVYVGGGTAAPTYGATLTYGDGYSVTSPTIAGYTVSTAVVSGTMGDQDITITVYYSPIQNNPWVLIDDYGTPLGFNGLTLNAGDCVE